MDEGHVELVAVLEHALNLRGVMRVRGFTRRRSLTRGKHLPCLTSRWLPECR